MKPLDYFFDTPANGPERFPQRFATFFAGLVRVVFGLLFRYKGFDLQQLEKIPAGSGYIIAGNHRSYLDPLFIMSLLRPKVVRYMCKEEFFTLNGAVGRMASWVGAYPVKRDSADMQVVKRSVRMLKRGEPVGIFPEGTRIRFPGQVATYHEGIALISQMAGVSVVPVRHWGTEKICPPGKRFFRCPQVTVRFGEPLNIADEPWASLPKEQRFKAFTEEVMRRVYTLELPQR
ncbi:MAG: 1-acyl-sn-glycerol-3-phosphate acyltransferase [Coriobacteriales bacterium]|jgi:1-acyl-sn-glycerol-3-phosphate acyltransferase|nr:1-acyl-sn-glycerol-3-phosphate acyltransferase [Coriobacteriales bacterium]